MKVINGQLFKSMVISASNNLYNHYPEVDALNVFPVPDGDTGMNMNLTLTSGSKEVQNRNDANIYTIAKTFSRGLLMGARGNSGVITSQIFRGFADGLAEKEEANASDLSEALENGVKIAYKAVIKPVEGTILTVIRETSEKLKKKVHPGMSIEECFDVILSESNESLKRTPNLLPVLKEVGVVDSGGAGLVRIFEGMKSAINGVIIERKEATATDVNEQVDDFEITKEDGYCAEFVLKIELNGNKKPFDFARFKSVLEAHGTQVNVKQEGDLVFVHIHTLNPGNLFNFAQQFGDFSKIKIENMKESHSTAEFSDKFMESEKCDENGIEEEKEYALIATSSGKGIDELFNEVGVNYIVSGGQTMNPSTNDFVNIIEKCNAKVCYIFPNNGNIILAATQAKEILKDKVQVLVIPTKTIMQGVVSAMNFNADLCIEDNVTVMEEAIATVKSGSITFAIKDSEINGQIIKKDDYMAIKESKDIISTHKDKFEALLSLLTSLVDENAAIITILYGKDVESKEMDNYLEVLNEKFPNIDIDCRDGGQPVYSFLVGVE